MGNQTGLESFDNLSVKQCFGRLYNALHRCCLICEVNYWCSLFRKEELETLSKDEERVLKLLEDKPRPSSFLVRRFGERRALQLLNRLKLRGLVIVEIRGRARYYWKRENFLCESARSQRRGKR